MVEGKKLFAPHMPIEVTQLESQPEPFRYCPVCSAPFEAFLRGQVQRLPFVWYAPWKAQPYCAIICRSCKEIVGYENP